MPGVHKHISVGSVRRSPPNPTVDASQFVGDDDVDEDATAEAFLLAAGLSTAVFSVTFNVPFIVAPSALYATREPGYVWVLHETLPFVSEKTGQEYRVRRLLALRVNFHNVLGAEAEILPISNIEDHARRQHVH